MNIDIPEIVSARLVLRRHVEGDLDASAAMWGDAEVVRHIGGRAFTREEVWHRVLRYLGHWSLRPFGYWAIHERTGDRFVGEIGLADWKRGNVDLGSPEAGWALTPAAQGRGYATEAIGAMLAWADALPIETTCCIIQSGNIASIRLAERFGYVAAQPATKTKVPIMIRSITLALSVCLALVGCGQSPEAVCQPTSADCADDAARPRPVRG